MKKILYLIFILISLSAYSQKGSNVFSEADSESSFNKTNVVNDGETQANPQVAELGGGNPGDVVPIDNYIPVLILIAVGIIIYTTHKKRKLLTQK